MFNLHRGKHRILLSHKHNVTIEYFSNVTNYGTKWISIFCKYSQLHLLLFYRCVLLKLYLINITCISRKQSLLLSHQIPACIIQYQKARAIALGNYYLGDPIFFLRLSFMLAQVCDSRNGGLRNLLLIC